MTSILRRGLALALVLAPSLSWAMAPPPRPPRGPVLEIATDPEHPGPVLRPAPDRYRPYGSRRASGIGAGFHLALGKTRQKYSDDGVYGRVAFRGMIHDPEEAGPLGVVTPLGLDGWRSREGWGLGMPFDFGLGYATPHLLLYGVLGWSLFTVDHERNRTGFGVLSPLAGAGVGVELEPVRILLDARAIYRWHIGTNDTPQSQLGVAVELFTR